MKGYKVLQKFDDPFCPYGCVEWMVGNFKESKSQLRKRLEERFPKEKGFIIIIGNMKT